LSRDNKDSSADSISVKRLDTNEAVSVDSALNPAFAMITAADILIDNEGVEEEQETEEGGTERDGSSEKKRKVVKVIKKKKGKKLTVRQPANDSLILRNQRGAT